MKTYELFEKMSPALAAEMLVWLQGSQKPIYKAAIQGLANQRNLRAVFVERKPASDRHLWMKGALGRKISNEIGEHVLQAWLLGAQRGMLCQFLDALEIKHDEDGTVEKIPESPSKEKVNAAVDTLLANHPAESVAVYLSSFRGMDETSDWPALRERLAGDPRLKLGL